MDLRDQCDVFLDEAVTGRSREEIGCPAGPDESFDLDDGDNIDSIRASYLRICKGSREQVVGLGLDDIVEATGRGRSP